MKSCSHCGITKPFSAFYPHAHGYSSWCQACAKNRSALQAASGYFRLRRQRLAKLAGKLPRLRLTRLQVLAAATYRNIRKRSMRNGLAFNLNREDVEMLFSIFCETNHHELTGRSPFQPSLDRIDGRRGYTKDNVRVVWLIENYARNNFSDEQLIEFCRRKLGF